MPVTYCKQSYLQKALTDVKDSLSEVKCNGSSPWLQRQDDAVSIPNRVTAQPFPLASGDTAEPLWRGWGITI